MRRGLLIAYAVFFAALATIAPSYQKRREEQSIRRLQDASYAIRKTLDGYSAALKNGDLAAAYKSFGLELQQKTPFESFRAQQLEFGINPSLQQVGALVTEYVGGKQNGPIVGFLMAAMPLRGSTEYFAFKFAQEQGGWKIVAVMQKGGPSENPKF